MALALTRMFAFMTLVSYLLVGAVAVKFYTAKNSKITISLEYFSLLKTSELESPAFAAIEAPEYEFGEIQIPAKVQRPAKPKHIKDVSLKKVAKSEDLPKPAKISNFSLPFHEPVVLKPVQMTTQAPSNLLALYRPAPEEIVEVVAKAPTVLDVTELKRDEIHTQQAAQVAVVDDEPTFLDYSLPEEKNAPATESPAKELTEVAETVVAVEAVEKGRGAVDKGRGAVENTIHNSTEEVAIDDLITFDYSNSQNKAVDNSPPTITKMTIQAPKVSRKGPTTQAEPRKSGEEGYGADEGQGFIPQEEEGQGLVGQDEVRHIAELSIQAVGTDLKKHGPINGFEIRFQDDLSETKEDYGSGSVTLREELAAPSMTRSLVILKRGYTPTNTDLILEQGAGEVSLPLIEESVFNEHNSSFEARGPVGAVLIELDDQTEEATLDVPFGKILHLDGDLKETTREDYRYQLFIGVRVGNALLSYKDMKGGKASKIIHVHENEVTFEANFYEDVGRQKIALFEEGLLAKEKTPLIIGADQVKIFAMEEASTKVADHVYKLNFNRHLLGNRRYLEINHLEEPLFVGLRGQSKVVLPSEHFMRFILSRLEGARLGDRCLVQVNLSKKVDRVEVGSESASNALMTYTQMLDADGRFYDSASDKTRKVIIVGENQGAGDYGQDAKLNVKIIYTDGSSQYLSSYCSPNTYLVEQL